MSLYSMIYTNNKTGFRQTTSFVYQFSVVWSVSKFAVLADTTFKKDTELHVLTNLLAK